MISQIRPHLNDYPNQILFSSNATNIAPNPTINASLYKCLGKLDYRFNFNRWNARPWHLNQSVQEAARASKKAQVVALGDLHGSFHKLVETLIVSGLVDMPPDELKKFIKFTKELYTSLPDLYNPVASASINNILNTKAIIKDLQTLVPKMTWANDDRKLILIGDAIADRGPTDELTLDIIAHLRGNKPERIISIASNHDLFALYYLIGIPSQLRQQQVSLIRANNLTENINGLKHKYLDFLAHTQLLYYNPLSQTLYSHAPIKVKMIKRFIQFLKRKGFSPNDHLEYKDINELNLPQFIKKMNDVYYQYVDYVLSKGNLKSLVNDPATKILTAFLENREANFDKKQLPFYRKGVKRLVYGHTHTEQLVHSLGKNVFNDYRIITLDQAARKQGCNGPEPGSSLFLDKLS